MRAEGAKEKLKRKFDSTFKWCWQVVYEADLWRHINLRIEYNQQLNK